MSEETRLVTKRSFRARSSLPKTAPLAIFLYQLIDTKKSNLCLSADVTSTAELLQLANEVGDSIAVLKTHADIITDFGESTIRGITEISLRKRFLVFEDRKFGDIGSK
jgi:uridine monophosphate synthetase